MLLLFSSDLLEDKEFLALVMSSVRGPPFPGSRPVKIVDRFTIDSGEPILIVSVFKPFRLLADEFDTTDLEPDSSGD